MHPRTVLGLSDGGAHCGLICDASMPTFLLTHWARDRSRGERIAVEDAVRLQTSATAALYGFHDRGVLAPGKKGDLIAMWTVMLFGAVSAVEYFFKFWRKLDDQIKTRRRKELLGLDRRRKRSRAAAIGGTEVRGSEVAPTGRN